MDSRNSIDDVKSRGGYVVCPATRIDGESYTITQNITLAELPENIRVQIGNALEKDHSRNKTPLCDLDLPHNVERAHCIAADFAHVVAGARNSTVYAYACTLKDYAVSETTPFELLSEWNLRSPTPLPDGELEATIENAFAHGQNQPGCKAVEADADLTELIEDLIANQKAASAALFRIEPYAWGAPQAIPPREFSVILRFGEMAAVRLS